MSKAFGRLGVASIGHQAFQKDCDALGNGLAPRADGLAD